MNRTHDEDIRDIADLPVSPQIRIERATGFGNVPGLDNEGLFNERELERWVEWQEWGPILALPFQKPRSTIRPTIDENGRPDWGAYGTVDYELQHGPFDRARYKADRLGDELRGVLITIDIVRARLPPAPLSLAPTYHPARHPPGRAPHEPRPTRPPPADAAGRTAPRRDPRPPSLQAPTAAGLRARAADGRPCPGTHAFLTDYSTGLIAFDVSTPADPQPVGLYETGGAAVMGVMRVGDYVYAAGYDTGLQVISVADPTDPIRVGACDTPGYVFDLDVADGYVYLVDAVSYPYDALGVLHVINVAEPTAPFAEGACETGGYAFGVAAAGGYAYVADAFAGVQVFDVSPPPCDWVGGTDIYPTFSFDVALAGTRAYVGDWNIGLLLVDVSDPAAPAELGRCSVPGTAGRVAVSTPLQGAYAYVAAGSAGVHVVDTSDPYHPFRTGTYNTPGAAESVAVVGTNVAVADWFAGVRLLDVSDPTHPVSIGWYDTPGNAEGVAGDGAEYLYVADGLAGLVVLRTSLDCNRNRLPDDCDLDCGAPGGRCAVPGCGQSMDCNGTGLPDECELLAGGDYTADGQVDLNDYQAFVECQGGPAVPPASGDCADTCLAAFDAEHDGDVDLADFAVFQTNFTG
ncbi:MAG TPA: hypothetical protein PKK06_05525 [Phycisphaerae bacterium]|nr:hypothetical protein [Phycisphaerae bacterium]HNU44782.1 hypothetical protein [Phycisphaerae bacterium]